MKVINKFKVAGFTGLILLVTSTTNFTLAQTHQKIPKSSDSEKLKALITKNPNNVGAHDSYMEFFNVKDPLLINQYKLWAQEFPKSAIVKLELGKILMANRDSNASDILLQATALNPALGEGWYLLGNEASSRNDTIAAIGYNEKAAKADRKNPDFAYIYASSLRTMNSVKADSLFLNMTWRFPGTEQAAKALFFLADNTQDSILKMGYFEALRNAFSSTPQLEFYSIGMNYYYDYLLRYHPEKAFDVALAMYLVVKKNHYLWYQKYMAAKAIITSKQFIKDNQTAEALKAISATTLKEFPEASAILEKFKAEVQASTGDTRGAYVNLIQQYIRIPTNDLHLIILNYGKSLNKTDNEINLDIQKVVQSFAVPAKEFSLESYADSKKISLKDLRGKIVLLTYWFPSCGPCREEFPHFESVLKKFPKDQIVYLGINTDLKSDKEVLPFMKMTGYSFIPLREDGTSVDRGNLSAMAAPTNFLIDKNGNLAYSNFRINSKNTEVLENMINSLLTISQ